MSDHTEELARAFSAGYKTGHDEGYSEGLERGREVEDADRTDAHVRAHVLGERVKQLEAQVKELQTALLMAVDHLDEECCEGFAANNAPQRQRLRRLACLGDDE